MLIEKVQIQFFQQLLLQVVAEVDILLKNQVHQFQKVLEVQVVQVVVQTIIVEHQPLVEQQMLVEQVILHQLVLHKEMLEVDQVLLEGVIMVMEAEVELEQ